MGPFDFIIVFFSFGYALALTHLLYAATRMIRHRRKLVFSWPHALWMACALLLLIGNWISLWDFRGLRQVGLGMLLVQFGFVAILYFVCALVAPDFEDGESFDMQAFHAREGQTYVAAFLVLELASIAANLTAGAAGIANWAESNLAVLIMLPTVVPALLARNRIVQILCPALLLVEGVVFLAVYYPVLR